MRAFSILAEFSRPDKQKTKYPAKKETRKKERKKDQLILSVTRKHCLLKMSGGEKSAILKFQLRSMGKI